MLQEEFLDGKIASPPPHFIMLKPKISSARIGNKWLRKCQVVMEKRISSA